jgi:Family of unknown function (DUF6427)
MITRFFNTSKPIHLVIISVFTLIIFVTARVNQIEDELSLNLVIKEIGKFSVVLISILTLNFLVRKNKLTHNNNFDILFYSLLLSILPITMQGVNILLANFFILLALRRIISLRSNINIKKKLFDAAFWIAIASLFYFWAILFFALIIAALLLYSIAHFKNWIIPFVGVLVVVIITMGYSIIFNGDFGMLYNYYEPTNFNFSEYNSKTLIFAVTVITLLSVWALIGYVLKLNQIQKRYRSAYILIFIAFFIGLAVILIAPHKNGSEFLFVFSALAIVMANFVESIKIPWLAELYVWLLILTPLTLLML